MRPVTYALAAMVLLAAGTSAAMVIIAQWFLWRES